VSSNSEASLVQGRKQHVLLRHEPDEASTGSSNRTVDGVDKVGGVSYWQVIDGHGEGVDDDADQTVGARWRILQPR
jgi:hypothetical protein